MGPNVTANECVCFEARLFDTHKASYEGVYTFPITGEYLIFNEGAWRRDHFRAGDTIPTPERVIGEYCPGFGAISIRLKP